MQLARFLNNVFKKDGFILIDANSKSYIIGVKDSSYNLFENLKIDNFSVLPGSESKLFKGLQLSLIHI